MKILLANHHLRDLGGSETFTYAIYQELKRRKHEVKVFTFEHGYVSQKMGNDVIPRLAFSGDKNPWGDGKFDLAIVMHNTCLKKIRKIPEAEADRVVFICNSIFERLEQPVGGADEYIAISEEVQEHLAKKGYESRVVRNGVDLDRFMPLCYFKYHVLEAKDSQFTPVSPSNTGISLVKGYPEELKVVLQISNKPDTKHIVKQACVKLGLDYITVGLPLLSVWNVERLIWAADLVVSIGRGAYEAMACGRPVIVLDVHGMEGLVKAENVEAMRWYNCSGRWRNQACNEDTVMNALLEAKNYYFNEERQRDNIQLDEYRIIAEEYFDIKKTVDELIN